MSDKLQVVPLSEGARLPRRSDDGAAGYDISAAEDVELPPRNGRATISTGLSMTVPVGTYGRIAPRSGLASRDGIAVLGGVVDRTYTGEVKVVLLNTGDHTVHIGVGDRIAQLVLEVIKTPEVCSVDKLDVTARGAGGFGSTGS